MLKCIFFVIGTLIFSFVGCKSNFEKKVDHLSVVVDSIFQYDVAISKPFSNSLEKKQLELKQNQLWGDYWKKRDQIVLEKQDSKQQKGIFKEYWLELLLAIVAIILAFIGFSAKSKKQKKEIDDTEWLIEKEEEFSQSTKHQQSQQDKILEEKSLYSQEVKKSSKDVKQQLMEDFGISESEPLELKNFEKPAMGQQSFIDSNKQELHLDSTIISEQEKETVNQVLSFQKRGYTPAQIAQILKIDISKILKILD